VNGAEGRLAATFDGGRRAVRPRSSLLSRGPRRRPRPPRRDRSVLTRAGDRPGDGPADRSVGGARVLNPCRRDRRAACVSCAAEPRSLSLRGATAFHWLDSEQRVRKAAQALRDGGSLPIVTTHHVAGGDASFFEHSQACYERWDPATTPGFSFPSADDVPMGAAEIEDEASFARPQIRRYEAEIEYTTASYLDPASDVLESLGPPCRRAQGVAGMHRQPHGERLRWAHPQAVPVAAPRCHEGGRAMTGGTTSAGRDVQHRRLGGKPKALAQQADLL
jgi:hypothetical protein